MPRTILIALMLSLLASACSSPSPIAPTPSFTPTNSEPTAPEPTPTKTSAPPTPTPAPVEFTASLGVSADFAQRLEKQKINESFNEKGEIAKVTAGYNQDGMRIWEENIKIVASGVNFQTDFQGNILKDANGNPIAQDIHNIGYPDGIVTAVDEQGRVLHWNETRHEWMTSLRVSNDIFNPTLYPKGRQDAVIETALLNPELNKVFDEDAVNNYLGWAILSEYDPATDSSHAQLNPRDWRSIRFALDQNGKPAFFTDGANESALVQLLNPADPKNVNGDETMFALATAGEWWSNTEENPTLPGNTRALFADWFMDKDSPNYREDIFQQLPILDIAQTGDWYADHSWGTFPNRPNLDSLFSQPGNDVSELPNPITPGLTYDYWLSGGMEVAKTDPKHLAQINWDESFITADFQKILFALSFASK